MVQKEQRIKTIKGHNTATINREKRKSILAHADQYEKQNEEEISMIPSVNDLLE